MGGAPGVGKSTLLLQVVSGLAERKRLIHYGRGELGTGCAPR